MGGLLYPCGMSLQIPAIFLRRSFQPTIRWWPVVAFALMLFSCLYRDLPIYHGRIGADPDNYVRADQVRQLIQHHETLQDWFTTRHLRIEPPAGIDVFSRLVDLPILAIAWPLSVVMDVNDAVMTAAFILPLFILLPLFFAVSVWAYRPLLGERWRWLAPLLLIASPTIANEFVPGRIDHHNWQLILTTSAFGLVCRLLLEAAPRTKHAVWLAIVSAVSTAIGLETIPYLGVMWAAVFIRLWLQPVLVARAAFFLGAVMPLAGLALLALLRAPAEWGRQTLILPSLAELSILVATSITFMLGACIAPLFRNLFARTVVMAAVVLLAAAGLAWVQPEVIRQGAWLGFDSWYIDYVRSEVFEQKSAITSHASWPKIVLGLALANIGYGLAIWRRRILQSPMLLACALAVMTGMMGLFFAARVERFFGVFAVPGLILVLEFGLARLAQKPISRARTGAEILLVVLCILLPGAWGGTMAGNGKVADLAFFTVPAPEKTLCDEEVLSLFLPIAYPDAKTILVSSSIGPQLVWATPHRVMGGGIYDNTETIRMAKLFFETPDAKVAAGVIAQNKIDLLLVCNIKNLQSVASPAVQGVTNKAMDMNSTIMQLGKKKIPDWLRHIDIPLDDNDALYQVVPDKLDAALNPPAAGIKEGE